MNRYYLILEAVAGTLFGYSMYTHLSSVDTLATLRHTAIPSAIVGGLFVFGLSHVMTIKLMPRNRIRMLLAFILTLAGFILFTHM